jgi:hypothetical protein
MSNANASAIRRRATPGTTTLSNQNAAPSGSRQPVSNSTSSPNVNNPGLTLPQVIALVDKRLIMLESFVNQSKENPNVDSNTSNIQADEFEKVMETITNEINERFEMFAVEIANLKEIVLKLQSYTMDVNKVLIEKTMALGDLKEPIFEESKDTTTSIDIRDLVEQEVVPLESSNEGIIFSNN